MTPLFPNDPLGFAQWAVGMPFEPGAGGPDAFDCYGLFAAYFSAVHLADMPAAPDGAEHSALLTAKTFRKVEASGVYPELEAPAPDCAVLMARKDVPYHIGVWVNVDRGKILHADPGSGCVIFEPVFMAEQRGWRGLRYFRVLR